MKTENFTPDMTKGWMIRSSFEHGKGGQSWSWLYSTGAMTGYGPLDYSALVFRTKADASDVARTLGGRQTVVERVTDSVAFEISECKRRHEKALAGDHPNKDEIAQANLDTIEYLEGRRSSRR